jgi:hypothetical protein
LLLIVSVSVAVRCHGDRLVRVFSHVAKLEAGRRQSLLRLARRAQATTWHSISSAIIAGKLMAKSTNRQPANGGGRIGDDSRSEVEPGRGGELHQTASGDIPVLTTAQGGPISDDQNTLKIGPRGPTLIEDFHFREKIFPFRP